MESESQIPAAVPIAQTYTQLPVEVEPKPQSKAKKVLLVLGVLLLLGIVVGGYAFYQGVKDGPMVSQEVTTFLQYAAANDVTSAYSMTSSEFKKEVSKEKMSQLFTLKSNFADFKEQSQTGFTVSKNVGQPTLYKYSGKIIYTDGGEGTVEATMVKEDGVWKILGIYVNVGMERLQKYQQAVNSPVLGVSTQNLPQE